MNGDYKEYFSDGGLSVEGKYTAGLKTGTWVSMSSNELMYSIGEYKSNLRSGLWKYFDEKGNLESEGQYKNGLKTGQWIYYYSSGKLKSIGSFEADLKSGLWGHFYENEQLIQDENWKHGGLYDISDYFSLQGEVWPKGTLTNGTGTRLVYYVNGELQHEELYKNGLPHGKWKSYHDNGKIQFEGSYRDGQPTGSWKYYNRKGKLKRTQFHG